MMTTTVPAAGAPLPAGLGVASGAHPVVEALAAVAAAVDEVAGLPVWSLSDAGLLGALAAGERAAAKLAAVRLSLVREADGRDVASRSGAASAAALLRWQLRVAPGEAKARVDLAAALDGPLAATGAALAAGDISVEQAQAIYRVVRALPKDTPSATARDAEAALLGFAATFDAKDLALLGAHLRHVLDPDDLDERERRAAASRELRFIDQGDGTHRVRGVLDNEAVATLRAALDPLAAPRPDPNNPDPDPEPKPADPDPASADTNAGANASGGSDASAGTDAGGGSGASAGADPDSASGSSADANAGTDAGGSSGAGAGAGAGGGSGASTGTNAGGGSDAGGGGKKARDPRSPGRRLADALVGLADLALGGGWLPSSGGVRPHVTVTATVETLLGLAGAPAAESDWGGPVSLAALRRLSCDSWVTRVLLNSDGVPLDVGREHRLVTPGLRRAVVARDRCCTFPGCDRPPSWCIAHHVIHWADGGTTSLDNLVLLCERHHTVIHHGNPLPHGRPQGRETYALRPPDLLHDPPRHAYTLGA
jgi:hypothetical protein